MGIEIIENPDPGPACPAMFDGFPAPDKVFLTFSGIKKGNTWFAGLGPPLNQTFEIPNFFGIPCAYQLGVGAWWVLSSIIGGLVTYRIALQAAPFSWMFNARRVPPIVFFINSGIDDPAGVPFYEGYCTVAVDI